jgi:hypothetical protein
MDHFVLHHLDSTPVDTVMELPSVTAPKLLHFCNITLNIVLKEHELNGTSSPLCIDMLQNPDHCNIIPSCS